MMWTRTLAICLAFVAAPALAHTQDGSLGDAAAATDYYQVTCSDDGSGMPLSVVVGIYNRSAQGSPAALVVAHRGIAATSAADTGGDTTTSPLVAINGGDGVYNVFVSKAAAGAVNYTLTFHCMTGENGGGLHTGTTIVFRQNQ